VNGLEQLAGEGLWLAVPAMLLAGLVHGTFGIGFPLVATPLLALVTDVRTAVLITLLPTMAVNIAILFGSGDLRSGLGRHWRVIPFVLIGAVLGTMFLTALDPRPFLLLLAGAILLYLNQHRIAGLDLSWVRRRTSLAYALFGLTAGLMAGTVNVMVPVMIILAMELGMPTLAMVQLFNLNFLSAKLTQSLVFLHGGQLTSVGLVNTLPLIPVALTALFAGMWLRHRISEKRYHSVLRGVLWLMAAVLVVRFFLS
jgi:uncharacterized membrane protein YfcA